MPKPHKSPMYECQVFFPDTHPKRWKYVTDLRSFCGFLSKSHPAWKYVNVYQKGTKQYLQRFYPGGVVPKVLGVLLLLLTQKFTFGHTSNTPAVPHLYENTSSAAAGTLSTSSNDFNNRATILTQGREAEGL